MKGMGLREYDQEVDNMPVVTRVKNKLTTNLAYDYKVWARREKQREVSLETFADWLDEYLMERAAVLEERGRLPEQEVKPKFVPFKARAKPAEGPRVHLGEGKEPECPLCGRAHSLLRCSKYAAAEPRQKREWLQEDKRCFLCLRQGHLVRECT